MMDFIITEVDIISFSYSDRGWTRRRISSVD